jgi:hypothetical protein
MRLQDAPVLMKLNITNLTAAAECAVANRRQPVLITASILENGRVMSTIRMVAWRRSISYAC